MFLKFSFNYLIIIRFIADFCYNSLQAQIRIFPLRLRLRNLHVYLLKVFVQHILLHFYRQKIIIIMLPVINLSGLFK